MSTKQPLCCLNPVAIATSLERRKMKKLKHIAMAMTALTIAGAAGAQTMTDSGYYAEIGYTPLEIKFDGDSSSVKPNLVRLIVGKDVHENLAIEAMVATTVAKDTQNIQGTEIKTSATAYGLYLKPKVALTKDTELFARLGFANTKTKLEVNTGESATGNDSSASYGIGITTKFSKDVYGGLDYVTYYSKDGTNISGLTASIGVRF